jgi:hypothetical protein
MPKAEQPKIAVESTQSAVKQPQPAVESSAEIVGTPAAVSAPSSSSSPQAQDILNVPSEWPASFPQPAAATRVLTYVFEEKDSSKVEDLLKFLKEKFLKAKVSVVKDKLGFSSVSITQLGGGKPVEVPSSGSESTGSDSTGSESTGSESTLTATADCAKQNDGACDTGKSIGL